MSATTWSAMALPAPVPSRAPPRSFTTTFAPREVRSRAWARPRPPPAPVTMATRPSSLTSLMCDLQVPWGFCRSAGFLLLISHFGAAVKLPDRGPYRPWPARRISCELTHGRHPPRRCPRHRPGSYGVPPHLILRPPHHHPRAVRLGVHERPYL